MKFLNLRLLILIFFLLFFIFVCQNSVLALHNFYPRKNQIKHKTLFSPKSFSHKKLISWPLLGRVSSEFGPRWNKLHKGIDIAAPVGRPIYAVDFGVVEFSGVKSGYGKTLILRHKNIKTLYAHCKNLLFKKGEKISKRQVIAHVGLTGKTFGSHLHFEVRSLDNKPLNPRFFLPIVAGTV